MNVCKNVDHVYICCYNYESARVLGLIIVVNLRTTIDAFYGSLAISFFSSLLLFMKCNENEILRSINNRDGLIYYISRQRFPSEQHKALFVFTVEKRLRFQ